MKDKHYLYRVAVTCYVDSLFYETGNARRCHERCHSLITQTLCGIGKSTCRNYLRYDRSELLAEVRIPPALKELLHLYVLLVTKCPQTIIHKTNRCAFKKTKRCVLGKINFVSCIYRICNT